MASSSLFFGFSVAQIVAYFLPDILLLLVLLMGLLNATVKTQVKTKYYQYKITFSPYMLTPTERYWLNACFLLSLSFISYATFYYLPSHIRAVITRIFYYIFDSRTPPILDEMFPAVTAVICQ